MSITTSRSGKHLNLMEEIPSPLPQKNKKTTKQKTPEVQLYIRKVMQLK